MENEAVIEGSSDASIRPTESDQSRALKDLQQAYWQVALSSLDGNEQAELEPTAPTGAFVDQLELALELFEGERLSEGWKPREDLHSLEFPLFSLQKGKDTRIREYRNGDQIVRITPSVIGAANIFDKDLLTYVATQISKAIDEERAISRRISFNVRDFLKYTRRSTGGASYVRIVDSCRRLKGTSIETNFDSSSPGMLICTES